LAAYGIPEPDIAEMLKIDPKTLRKHYRQELDFDSVKPRSAGNGTKQVRRGSRPSSSGSAGSTSARPATRRKVGDAIGRLLKDSAQR
jgi:hypothetical protein